MDRRHFIGVAGALGTATVLHGRERHRDVSADLNDSVFNVKDFGAAGDGRTADSEALQKAFDAAGKVRGTVWFPSGVYLCHDLKVPECVHLKADPVWLYRGEEAGAVLKLDSPGATCLLNITGAFGVHIYGLVLEGIQDAPDPVHGIYQNNREGSVPVSDNGWSKKEDSFVFDDIKVMQFSGHGMYLRNIWLFIIRHSHFFANRGDGVCICGWDGFVTDNQFSGNGGNGFGCEGKGSTVMFTANRVEWNRRYGLHLMKGDDWNITGNSFDRNWGAGLCIENTKVLAVTGNVFRRCGKDSSALPEGGNSCQVRIVGAKGLSMTGNSCLAGVDDGGKGPRTPRYALAISGLQYSVITGNAFYNGYMEDMLLDLGGHRELLLKDNTGCPY